MRGLETMLSMARDSLRTFRTVGLILTGSCARGEGVIVRDGRGRIRWLSDIECLVVIPDSERGNQRILAERLRQISGERLLDRRRHWPGIKVELSAICASRLATMRQSIFSHELCAHGKLLSGSPADVPMPQRFDATRAVLDRDSFRLLNNRIVEQLSTKLPIGSSHDSNPDADTAYAVSKFWIELWTSLSVFLDCYRSTYRQREIALEGAVESMPVGFERGAIQALRANVKEAMALKFGNIEPADYRLDAGLVDATDVAAHVWWWEAASLLGVNTQAPDWRAISRTFRRVDDWTVRLRDWGRLLLRRGERRNLRPAALTAVISAGSFGSAVYAAACLLYFFWDRIGSETEEGVAIRQYLARFFGVSIREPLALQSQLAKRTVQAWNAHLRSTQY